MTPRDPTLEPVLDVLDQHADDVDGGAFPAAGIEALRSAGLMGLTVDTEHGGSGPDPLAFAELLSAVAASCGSTAMVLLMHLCAAAVVAAAPPVGFPGLVEELATGKKLGTLAYSESGSRSHFWAPVSTATPDGDVIRLSGFKSWVTSAGYADVYVASCRAVGAADGTVSDQYVLPADTPGFTIAGSFTGLGLRGNASTPMAMEVEVSDAQRMGDPGGGFGLMMSVVLPWFNLGNAAVSLGLARGALDAAVAHASGTRIEPISSALSDLPTIRAYLAKAEVALRGGEALLRETARSIATPDEGTLAAVLAVKAGGNEIALQVTDLAMRVCGGAAFSKHLGIERRFRDARAGYVMAPTSDVLYDFLGRALCGIDLF